MFIDPLPIKMMEGCICLAAVNKALTNFSPSPTYLDVNVDALTNIYIYHVIIIVNVKTRRISVIEALKLGLIYHFFKF